MKSFVLMSNRTAEICEGFRVELVDARGEPLVQRLEGNHNIQVHMRVGDSFDGWIVTSPEAGGFRVWMNKEWVEKEFEILDELEWTDE